MKTKLLVAKPLAVSCLIGAIVLSIGYQSGQAESNKDEEKNTVWKIGVVSIRTIFQDCKRNVKYRKQAGLEEEQIIQELQQLTAEIKAAEAGLETRKRGTNDYLELAKELAQKRATLPLTQEIYEQRLATKDQQWTEKLYKDILQQTTELAKEKGIDLIFEKDEPEFPINSANELMLTIRTNKLLYSDGCINITNEVMARVDAMDNN